MRSRPPGGYRPLTNYVRQANIDGIPIKVGNRFLGRVIKPASATPLQYMIIDLGNGLRGRMPEDRWLFTGAEIAVMVQRLQQHPDGRIDIALVRVDKLDPKGPPQEQHAQVEDYLGHGMPGYLIYINSRRYAIMRTFTGEPTPLRPQEFIWVIRMGIKIPVGKEELELCCGSRFLDRCESIFKAIQTKTAVEGSFMGKYLPKDFPSLCQDGDFTATTWVFNSHYSGDTATFNAESCERLKAVNKLVGHCRFILEMDGIGTGSSAWDVVLAFARGTQLKAVLVEVTD